MGELEKLLMPHVTQLGALPGWVKVAWLLWLAWGAVQLEWRRRSRIVPEWRPRLAVRSAIDTTSVSERPAPAATVVFDLTPQPLLSEAETAAEPATKPKRRRRSRSSSRVNGSMPAHAPVVPELSVD